MTPERQETTRLRDGRLLAWSEWGPETGVPVIFCTGAGLSGSLGFGASAVGELGVRLVAVDRPGLGRSDPHPVKTLDTWVGDVRELSDARGLEGARAVGFSQGAPFALALAAAGLVEAVAVVSGQDELAHPSVRPLLHPEVERMVEAVERDAAAFEAQFAEIVTADALWRLIVDMSSEHDRAVYEGEAFAGAFRRALEEGFARGARGYARDLAISLGRWPFKLEKIATPVDLWYGGRDASPVHSPDFGATLEARLPNATRTLDPDEGGSILWTRSRDILSHQSRSR
jgi:pimeloyl-ACP methyl ester carboxylesterase